MQGDGYLKSPNGDVWSIAGLSRHWHRYLLQYEIYMNNTHPLQKKHKTQGDAGRCTEAQGDAGETQGDVQGRCRETNHAFHLSLDHPIPGMRERAVDCTPLQLTIPKPQRRLGSSLSLGTPGTISPVYLPYISLWRRDLLGKLAGLCWYFTLSSCSSTALTAEYSSEGDTGRWIPRVVLWEALVQELLRVHLRGFP